MENPGECSTGCQENQLFLLYETINSLTFPFSGGDSWGRLSHRHEKKERTETWEGFSPFCGGCKGNG
jgi:hypothetical protein